MLFEIQIKIMLCTGVIVAPFLPRLLAEYLGDALDAENLEQELDIIPVAIVQSRFNDRLIVQALVILHPPDEIRPLFYEIYYFFPVFHIIILS
jgi:hypothetical protein